ncbi:MAG: ankyrin repeat domain-containing protein [Pseudomonadota bacterium]|nr:ankyrin repeat domain-containing protein [Pseudomonadota bacterium]QKK06160.1 MAG: ankyrin repeat domain-containing protein [Pseudomonadota bacterium]
MSAPKKTVKKKTPEKKTVNKKSGKGKQPEKKTVKNDKPLTPKQKEAAYRKLLRGIDGLSLMKALRENTELGHTENVRLMVDECYLKHHKPQKSKKKKQDGSKGRLWKDALDWTLPTAAANGQAAIAKILLDAGADIGTMENNALHMAVLKGHSEIVDLLLEHGADPRSENDQPLRFAATEGRADIAEKLIAAGADVHVKNDDPLRWASAKGHTDTVKVFLAAGADVHADNEGALRRAAAAGHAGTVKTLLEAGADIDKALEHAVLREEKFAMTALKMRTQDGWRVIDDFTVAHSTGNGEKMPSLTTIFSFFANEVAVTASVPENPVPSAPSLQSFNDYADKAKLEEAEKIFETHRNQRWEEKKAADAAKRTTLKK